MDEGLEPRHGPDRAAGDLLPLFPFVVIEFITDWMPSDEAGPRSAADVVESVAVIALFSTQVRYTGQPSRQRRFLSRAAGGDNGWGQRLTGTSRQSHLRDI